MGEALRLRFLLALAALALLAACSSRPDPGPVAELRIGLLAPLSNPVRFTGHLAARALVDEINARGGLEAGGRKLRVVLAVADTGATAEQTMAAMGKLLQQDRVAVIVGPYYSREALPVAAALEALRVPMLSPSATNPEVTRGRRYAFRASQLDSDQGRLLAQYAYDVLGLRRAAVLYDEGDAYSSGLAGYFKAAFEARKGAAVHAETYASGQQDFQAPMGRIAAANAQLLLLPNFPGDLSRQLQQARAAGFRGQLMGGDSWDTDRGFHSLPEAQGGMYTSEFAPEMGDPRALDLARALVDKAGAELNKDTALTLDALELLLAAASRSGGTDSESLRRGLSGLKGFIGLTGAISFGEGGDPERTACLMDISGGKASLRERLATARRKDGS